MKSLNLTLLFPLFFFSQLLAATTPETADCKSSLENRLIRVLSQSLKDELNNVIYGNAYTSLTVGPGTARSVNDLWSRATAVYEGAVLDLHVEIPSRGFFQSPVTITRNLFVEKPYDYAKLSGEGPALLVWNKLDGSHLLYNVQDVQNLGYDRSANRGAKFKALANGFRLATFSDYSAWYGRFQYTVITVTMDQTKPERVVSIDMKVYKNAVRKDWDTIPDAEGILYQHFTATDFAVVPEK